MKFSIISVDYQNDFCKEGGRFYVDRPCHSFIENEFTLLLKSKNIKLTEIVCDYRLPRPHETEEWCIPGDWGYESAIDKEIKLANIWVKGQHSPEWIRENCGDPNKKPGLPYQNPQAFSNWLEQTIGKPEDAGDVILIGLTLDCCVLCTAQQLYFRNYKVKILKEGSDIYDVKFIAEYVKHNQDYKNILFNSTHWACAEPISWEEFKNLYF